MCTNGHHFSKLMTTSSTTCWIQFSWIGFNFQTKKCVKFFQKLEVPTPSKRQERSPWMISQARYGFLGGILVFYVGVCRRSPVVKTGFGTLKALNLTNYSRSPKTFLIQNYDRNWSCLKLCGDWIDSQVFLFYWLFFECLGCRWRNEGNSRRIGTMTTGPWWWCVPMIWFLKELASTLFSSKWGDQCFEYIWSFNGILI